MKICCKCKNKKSKDSFNKKNNSPDGLRYICKKCQSIRNKEYYQKNREKIKKRQRKYRKTKEGKIAKLKCQRKRRRKNTKLRVRNNISRRIRASLKGKKNGRNWEKLVGYTMEDLRMHLEEQFEDWMNWDNWGVFKESYKTWQIDHIKPVSKFNFNSVEDEEFKQCWSLDNLQPLESYKNIIKSNKF